MSLEAVPRLRNVIETASRRGRSPLPPPRLPPPKNENGLSSYYELRKPAEARAPVARRDDNPFSFFGGGRRGGGRGGPGLFGWLFQ